ncbi:hypothetical protein ACVJ19_008549 [Bradyrhizobium sp. USDA 376]
MASAARSTMRRPTGSPRLACRITIGANAAVVCGSGFFGPGHRLIGIMVEYAQHLRKQWRQLAAAIRGPQRQSDNLQADVGAAAFVRHGKTVTGETDLAAVDQADTDRPCAGHHDSPIRAAMGAKTGREAVADEVNGRKGMRDLAERRFRAPAPNTGKANSGVHLDEILAAQSGLCGRRFGGLHDRPPSLVDADPRCGRSRARFSERRTVFVLDPGAATGSAAINAEIRGTFCSHGKLTRRFRLGSAQGPHGVHMNSCARLASRVRDGNSRIDPDGPRWFCLSHACCAAHLRWDRHARTRVGQDLAGTD